MPSSLLRRSISPPSTSASHRPVLRSMRIGSPVLSHDRPPPTALSGAACRIDGLSDVPDCRPSPKVGRVSMPCLMSLSGGCMLTTSAEPGHPIGPAPRITSTLFSSISRSGSFMRWW